MSVTCVIATEVARVVGGGISYGCRVLALQVRTVAMQTLMPEG